MTLPNSPHPGEFIREVYLSFTSPGCRLLTDSDAKLELRCVGDAAEAASPGNHAHANRRIAEY